MSTDQDLIKEIQWPDGFIAKLIDDVLEITGPLGSTSKDFRLIRVNIQVDSNKIILESFGNRKKHMATLGTAFSIINNLIVGTSEGFTYKLKTAFAHFPMSVKTEGSKILVDNFYGERSARVANIVGDSNVSIKGDEVIISGINLEHVSQTAANLEQSTRIKNKDHRVYLDGIYLFEKGRGLP